MPTSWQGTRIHRHWEPFLKPKDIGDLITVFYIFGDELGNSNNGTIDFFEETNNHYEHLWLPENLKSKYSYKPKLYDLIIMTADTWHRARPLKGKRFNGKRFSLATDVKLIKENNV